MLDTNTCHKARMSKDARFDGKFYTAVLTTGIFCRPICPARAPKEENVRYYLSAEQAQEAGYQPCKRCLPELAPNPTLPITIQPLITSLVEGNLSVSELADKHQLSTRQIQRIFNQELGLTPSQYLQQHRLLKARQLLTGTNIPITDVAFNSGFNSTRRFNEAIKASYQETPSVIRERLSRKLQSSEISILLHYRPPFDWQAMLEFFRLRQLPNVEVVGENSYQRTFTLGQSSGWFVVTPVEGKDALKLNVSIDNLRCLDEVIARVRRIFDLDADMSAIHQHLSKDDLLAPVIAKHQGIRLPGCWDIFEFSIRAILGQQVSVKAATTLAGRIAQRYGANLENSTNDLTLCFPTPRQLANADFQGLGLTTSRMETLKRWILFYLNQPKALESFNLDELTELLTAIKGIGPWTVNYLAMRGLSQPDAFPASDLGVIKALTPNLRPSPNLTKIQSPSPNLKPNQNTASSSKASVKEISARAEQWRPWRAYAAIYLWLSLS